MGSVELIILLVSSLCWLLMLALIALVPIIFIGSMFGLPFVYRSTWESWTSGTVAEAYDNVTEGATRGVVQIRPASYLFEKSVPVEGQPEAAIAGLAALYEKAPFVKILARDSDGLAVDLRIPNGLGPGWVGVFRVSPREGGSTVEARMRSTFCIPFPVFTLFLALSHHLHLERQIREASKG